MLPQLGPTDVRAQPPSHRPARSLSRLDDRIRERPAPRGRLLLEPQPRAAATDEMSDLVHGDEIGDLTADRWDSDLERCLTAPSAADRPPPSPVQALDAVPITELINMGVEVADALNRSRMSGGPCLLRASLALTPPALHVLALEPCMQQAQVISSDWADAQPLWHLANVPLGLRGPALHAHRVVPRVDIERGCCDVPGLVREQVGSGRSDIVGRDVPVQR